MINWESELEQLLVDLTNCGYQPSTLSAIPTTAWKASDVLESGLSIADPEEVALDVDLHGYTYHSGKSACLVGLSTQPLKVVIVLDVQLAG